MRRHVARRPRVGVVAPGPAHPVALLEDRVVAKAGPFELHGHGQAREPGADDGHPGRLGARRPQGVFQAPAGGLERHQDPDRAGSDMAADHATGRPRVSSHRPMGR